MYLFTSMAFIATGLFAANHLLKVESLVCQRTSATSGVCTKLVETHIAREERASYPLNTIESASTFQRRGKGKHPSDFCGLQIRLQNHPSEITLYSYGCIGDVQARAERDAVLLMAFVKDPAQKRLVMDFDSGRWNKLLAGGAIVLAFAVALGTMLVAFERRNP